ncbi:MAG: SUMF1/EgtB/PvdO family nonheme iron enzyme [Gammaproteobacteria bacterium]
MRCPEARAYCAWLGARTGDSFRLLRDAEWEAAARGEEGAAGMPMALSSMRPAGTPWRATFAAPRRAAFFPAARPAAVD